MDNRVSLRVASFGGGLIHVYSPPIGGESVVCSKTQATREQHMITWDYDYLTHVFLEYSMDGSSWSRISDTDNINESSPVK